MRRRGQLPQCEHGISDQVELTFRHVIEDFVRGTKTTVFGYWCRQHGRHGTFCVDEPTRKADIPEMSGQ